MDYEDLRGDRTALSADGVGSVVDLASATAFSGGAYAFGGSWTYTVQAINGGVLDLSGVTSLAGARTDLGDNNDWLRLTARNGGTIKLDKLATTAGAVWFDVETASLALPALQTVGYRGRFDLGAASTVSAPVLLSFNGSRSKGVGLNLGTNATFDAPQLASINDAQISLATGATLKVPALASLTDAQLSLSPGRTFAYDPAKLLNVDYSNLSVSGGSTLTLPAVTAYRMNYQDYEADRTALSADGTGSLLDLSHATTFDGAAFGYGGSWTYTVQGLNGGIVDLSGVTSVSGARTDAGDNNDWLRFTAQNGGTIRLDKLAATTGAVWFDVQVPSFTLPALRTVAYRGRFDLATGAGVSLPALQAFNGVRAKGVGFSLGTNATLDAPQLASINDAQISLGTGAVMKVPSLASMTYSQLSLSPGRSFMFDPTKLSSVDYSNLYVSGGAALSLPAVSDYRTDYTDNRANWLIMSADGAGSLLDLSHVTTFNGAAVGYGGQWTYTVQAVNGGMVDLSRVTNVTGSRLDAGDGNDWLRFAAQNGGAIKLDKLSATAGAVWFDVQVPSFTLPALQTVGGRGRFDLATGSTVSLPALQEFTGDRNKGVGFTLGTNATLDASQLAAINYAQISLAEGATFKSPALASMTYSQLALSPGRTFTYDPAKLSNVDYSNLSVSGGSTLTLSAVKGYAADYQDNRTNLLALSADGVGSLIDLSHASSFNGAGYGYGGQWTTTVQAVNGGVIDLSGVTSVAGARGDAGDGNDWLKFSAQTGGTIKLDRLRKVTGRTMFEVGTAGKLVVGDLAATETARFALTDLTSTLDVNGSLYLSSTSGLSAAPLSNVYVRSSFVYASKTEADVDLASAALHMAGSGLQFLEVGGEDAGIDGFTAGNFGVGQLVVGEDGRPTTVQLVDVIDNGNRLAGNHEALYLYGMGGTDGLIMTPGSTLILDHLNVYALMDGEWTHLNDAFANTAATEVAFEGGYLVLPEPGAMGAVTVGALGLLARRRRRVG
jgi:hypothetical protein